VTLPDSLHSALVDLDFDQGEPLGLSNQGEVRRFRIDGLDLAIKRPKGRGLAWRLRAATIRHEYRAYEKLDGLDGIPSCYGLLPGDRLVLAFVQGSPLRDVAIDRDSPFYPALLDLIQAMHARGVAHGDLKRKANLLITPAGRPVILDFGTATLCRSGSHAVNRRLFELIRQTDLNAWIKLKYGGYENLSEDDQQLLRRTGIERWLSRLRRG
jgi:tRNA A-37 threonylcarbamoyl transferase component Bud32